MGVKNGFLSGLMLLGGGVWVSVSGFMVPILGFRF